MKFLPDAATTALAPRNCLLNLLRAAHAAPSVMNLGLAVWFLACAGAHAAESFPERPMRLIVPYPPGGGSDLMARLLGRSLSQSVGQSVVIDNRPGGNTVIGMEQAARAPADGSTFIIVNSSYVVLPLLQKDLRYRSVEDFSPVIRVAESPNIVVVRSSLQAASIGDLVALAKSKPGALNYAEGGFGGPSHLAAELFNYAGGITMARIPYKGTGPALIDLLGGQVDVMFASITGVLSHVKSGKLRALAVTGLQRSPAAPEMPTMLEAGVRDYEFVSWYGILAPSGTPHAIINKLYSDLRKVLEHDDVRRAVAAEGSQITADAPAQFARYIAVETKKWRAVITQMNIRPE